VGAAGARDQLFKLAIARSTMAGVTNKRGNVELLEDGEEGEAVDFGEMDERTGVGNGG
jgi:hypothetical protein